MMACINLHDGIHVIVYLTVYLLVHVFVKESNECYYNAKLQ